MPANQNGSFAGKVAFVTGAASGIGRATALAFARGVLNTSRQLGSAWSRTARPSCRACRSAW